MSSRIQTTVMPTETTTSSLSSLSLNANKKRMFVADMDEPSRPRRHPPPPVCSFLHLPIELREQIYQYTLNDRVDPPRNPSFGEHRHRLNGDIKYPTHYSPWRFPTLTWVNRQIRNEVLDLIGQLSNDRKSKAELDVMVNGYCFYPTWLFLPPDLPGDVPFDLNVHLRIFSTESFRSHDGWPRQPGAGFRSLLRLLQELVHQGPSFGQHLELLSGKALWLIHTLTLHVTFHDHYTPDTFPDTTKAIMRMSRALARDGLARKTIHHVCVHVEYAAKGRRKVFDDQWPVADKVDPVAASRWRQWGFLTNVQKTLHDDPRPPYSDSSGGLPTYPRRRLGVVNGPPPPPPGPPTTTATTAQQHSSPQ